MFLTFLQPTALKFLFVTQHQEALFIHNGPLSVSCHSPCSKTKKVLVAISFSFSTTYRVFIISAMASWALFEGLWRKRERERKRARESEMSASYPCHCVFHGGDGQPGQGTLETVQHGLSPREQPDQDLQMMTDQTYCVSTERPKKLLCTHVRCACCAEFGHRHFKQLWCCAKHSVLVRAGVINHMCPIYPRPKQKERYIAWLSGRDTCQSQWYVSVVNQDIVWELRLALSGLVLTIQMLVLMDIRPWGLYIQPCQERRLFSAFLMMKMTVTHRPVPTSTPPTTCWLSSDMYLLQRGKKHSTQQYWQ